MGSLSNQSNYYTGGYSVTQSSSYSFSQNYLTAVGSFTNSASAYGAFDMAGDVWNWNDAVISSSYRGCRGGSWLDFSSSLASSYRNGYHYSPSDEYSDVGFRVANAPEPNSLMLLGLGTALAASVRRRTSKV